MSNEQIKELEANIAQARKKVELGDALERLRKNRDFKTLILDGYFEKEAIRLVHLKADPNMQAPDKQASIITQIDAIGSLHMYLHLVDQMANRAESNILADEATIEELAAEELNNG